MVATASPVVAVGPVVEAGRVVEAIAGGVVPEIGVLRPRRRRRVVWYTARWSPSMGRRAAWCDAGAARYEGLLAGLAGAGTA